MVLGMLGDGVCVCGFCWGGVAVWVWPFAVVVLVLFGCRVGRIVRFGVTVGIDMDGTGGLGGGLAAAACVVVLLVSCYGVCTFLKVVWVLSLAAVVVYVVGCCAVVQIERVVELCGLFVLFDWLVLVVRLFACVPSFVLLLYAVVSAFGLHVRHSCGDF